jgi:glycine cleavage system aminomethyltransferase T
MQLCAGTHARTQTHTHTLTHTHTHKHIHARRSYVDKAYAKAGTELNLVVRGKAQKAVVTKMPFVPTTYFKG